MLLEPHGIIPLLCGYYSYIFWGRDAQRLSLRACANNRNFCIRSILIIADIVPCGDVVRFALPASASYLGMKTVQRSHERDCYALNGELHI